ncbi:MAG: hypothetical protein KDK51_04715 [Deltaproteobacteria bacterium]|nr:hypothetical protein [Deltaproteobacteria bacterium]
MNSLLFFAFINSVGVITMWIMLAPYYSSVTGGLSAFGIIIMVRQFSGILGNIFGGTIADHGSIKAKHFWCELSVVLSAILFATIFFIHEEIAIKALPLWVFFRFSIATISSVIFYKLLTVYSSKKGESSIVQMMVSQGAVIIAPILAIIFPILWEKSFFIALIFDIVTSITYIAVLLNSPPVDEKMDSAKRKLQPLYIQMIQTATAMFSKKLYPWNVIQILLLIGLGGFLVFVLNISHTQKIIPADIFFPVMSVFYGFSLWANGYIAKKTKKPINLFTVSIIGLTLSGGILLIDGLVFQLISFFIYVEFLWLALHLSNKILLDRAPKKNIGQINGSRALYLGLIFGITELIYGQLFDINQGITAMSYTRIVCGVGIILLLFTKNGKYS